MRKRRKSQDRRQMRLGQQPALEGPRGRGFGELEERLRSSIIKGDMGSIRALLARGADVRSQDRSGNTHAHTACDSRKAAAILEMLAGHGAALDKRNVFGETPLLIAARRGDAEAAGLLLEKGADADKADKEGLTALMRATSRRVKAYLGTLRALIDAGADVGARDGNGMDALMHAARNSNPDAVAMLLAKGADVHARDIDGNTALLIAVRKNRKSHIDTISLLMEHGADAAVSDSRGRGALALAGYSSLEMRCFLRKVMRERQLSFDGLERIREIDRKLLQAAGSGRHVELGELIRQGADVNAKDPTGMTALMMAAKGGRLRCVEVLLENGALVNMRDGQGWSAFRYAIMECHERTATVLRRHGGEY